jgi:hypothetical protein
MAVAVTGLGTLVVLKVLGIVALPALGLLFGFFALMFKIGLMVGLGFLAYYVFKKLTTDPI